VAASAASLVLAFAKGFAAWATGSLALAASALDSALDAVLSLGNGYGARLAAKPPDEDHRFGHGKAEALFALAQAVIVGAMALSLAAGGAIRLRSGEGPEAPLWAAAAAAAGLLVTLGITLVLGRAERRSGSLIVTADLAHYRLDLAGGAAVLVGLLLVRWTGIAEIDALLSVIVAVAILGGLRSLATRALADLTDAALPEDIEATVIEAVRAHPETIGFHELRTRRAGPHRFIAFHLELPAELTFVEAHRITEEVQDDIEAAIPGARVFIHSDPHELEHDGRRRRGAEIR
jgi:ferrous-iron efflux pump FieF